MSMSPSEQNDRLIRAILGRLDRDVEVESQENMALWKLMADDGMGLQEAGLSVQEASALWTLEALGWRIE